jgi:hypothetical protein
MSAAALDRLRDALRGLDDEDLVDRHGIDRVTTAALGLLRREQDAARTLRLFGGRSA